MLDHAGMTSPEAKADVIGGERNVVDGPKADLTINKVAGGS
jgi:hypothetical protein